MLCDKCKKNPATFHQVVNINGKITEKHLCSECAKKFGVLVNNANFDDDFDFFDDFGGGFFSNDTLKPVTRTKTISAPKKQKINVVNDDENVEIKLNGKNVKAVLKNAEKNDKLKADLKKAIEEERYEDASKIKEEIKQKEIKKNTKKKTDKNKKDKGE